VDARRRKVLQIEEMVTPASTGVFQREVGHIAPAVGFAAEKGNAIQVGHRLHKGRKLFWQRRERELIDNPVAFVVPGAERTGLKENGSEEDDRRAKAPCDIVSR